MQCGHARGAGWGRGPAAYGARRRHVF